MGLVLFDTMAGEKRAFEPADPKRVTMYVCGPTVYNHAHIGNFRAAVVFDLLFRVLRHRYGEKAVVYARNITDIDDKIIRAARETGAPIGEITKKYADIYRAEAAALNVLPPTLEPAATTHLSEMIALIEKLIEAGAAYAAEGHVLFAVDKFTEYGRLARVDRDEILAGARVEIAPYKRDPSDFVLWKPSKGDEPGWESPWGRGRPGWHLECSAMIEKAFGDTVDIHGGGQDLRFPHHENEIAQSACAHGGAPLARYWVHNGFLRMGADKMSKSLGNIVLLRDLLGKWPGEVLRWALLSAHYRQPLEWTDELLVQSKRQLDRFYRLLAEAPRGGAANEISADAPVAPPESVALALDDDLNTPEAIAGLHALRDIAVALDGEPRRQAIGRLKSAGELMGFFTVDPTAWFQNTVRAHEQWILLAVEESPSRAEIEALIAERADAKKAKDFQTADKIRDELAGMGVILEDGPSGTTWRRG